MDITALKIFLAVAETGGVTRAAEKLHYVQSNVTARLKQLEEDLGTPLFYRNGRKLQITPAGQILSGYAERILRLTEEARQAVQDSPEPRGTLLIGTMETTAAARMPQVLAQYHKRYPEVQLALETGTTRELIDAVLNYKLEAALIAAPLEHPELDAQIAFEEELVLITDLQQGPIESPQDIRNLTLLVFRAGCRYRQHLESWVSRLGGRAETHRRIRHLRSHHWLRRRRHGRIDDAARRGRTTPQPGRDPHLPATARHRPRPPPCSSAAATCWKAVRCGHFAERWEKCGGQKTAYLATSSGSAEPNTTARLQPALVLICRLACEAIPARFAEQS
jgi:DNA-binding transcriptional LysR family regulator